MSKAKRGNSTKASRAVEAVAKVLTKNMLGPKAQRRTRALLTQIHDTQRRELDARKNKA